VRIGTIVYHAAVRPDRFSILQPSSYSAPEPRLKHRTGYSDEKLNPLIAADSKTATSGSRRLERGGAENKSEIIPAVEIPSFLFYSTSMTGMSWAPITVQHSKPRQIICDILTGRSMTIRLTSTNSRIPTSAPRCTLSPDHPAWPMGSLLYSDIGSFMWEMAGERTRPSVNDLFTTGRLELAR